MIINKENMMKREWFMYINKIHQKSSFSIRANGLTLHISIHLPIVCLLSFDLNERHENMVKVKTTPVKDYSQTLVCTD